MQYQGYEDALFESEIKYRAFFENSMDAILLTNPNGEILSANQAMCNMFGYSEDELIKLGRSAILDLSDPRLSILLRDRKLTGKTRGEVTLLRKDRTPILAEVSSAIFKNQAGFERTSMIIRNITERKQTEEALRKSEQLYRSLFDNMLNGYAYCKMIFVDDLPQDFVYITVNQSFKTLTGLKDVVGKKVSDVIPGIRESDPVLFEICGRVASSGKPETIEIYLDALKTWFSMSVYSPEIEHFVATFDIITKRKNAEMELIKAMEKAEESDRLKTAFLHNISHEIRTPMNAIVGFSSLLGDPSLTPEKSKEYSDIIIQSSDQLLAIIDDIISIASIEAGQETIQENEININLICNLINEQFFQKAKDKNVTLSLKTTLADDEAIIITDAIKLTQILTNIIGNALKFTPQGYVNFGYTVKNNQLEFYVEDSGIGIPLDMQDIIFERFRQVETPNEQFFGGSGIGLPISKAYVEMLGGKIWLVSELGRGSVFFFTIHYKNTVPKKSPDTPSIQEINFDFKSIKTILIAEDENSNFMLLKEMLPDIGINILRAKNGVEAVELCKSNPQIDLVLMDLKMSNMDGFDATVKIKEFRPDLYIIAQTAYSTEADINKAFACGCSDFISKPLNRELLLSKICEQLQNKN
jgi:PAS domain S-box-containing protein